MKLLEILEILENDDIAGKLRLNDGAQTWSIDGLREAILVEEKERDPEEQQICSVDIDYTIEDHGIVEIKDDGYLDSIIAYKFEYEYEDEDKDDSIN